MEIQFSPANRKFYLPDDPVKLLVRVKNVKKLLVKVFEINTAVYYREKMSELRSDINLDGLGLQEPRSTI